MRQNWARSDCLPRSCRGFTLRQSQTLMFQVLSIRGHGTIKRVSVGFFLLDHCWAHKRNAVVAQWLLILLDWVLVNYMQAIGALETLADDEDHPVANCGVSLIELENWNETTRVTHTVRDQVLLSLIRLVLSLSEPKCFVGEFNFDKLQAWIYFLDELQVRTCLFKFVIFCTGQNSFQVFSKTAKVVVRTLGVGEHPTTPVHGFRDRNTLLVQVDLVKGVRTESLRVHIHLRRLLANFLRALVKRANQARYLLI